MLVLSFVCGVLLIAAPVAIFLSNLPDGGMSTDDPGGVYTGPGGEAEGGGNGGAPAPLDDRGGAVVGRRCRHAQRRGQRPGRLG